MMSRQAAIKRIPSASRVLGHSNVRTTLRYAQLADRDVAAAAQQIGPTLVRVMAAE